MQRSRVAILAVVVVYVALAFALFHFAPVDVFFDTLDLREVAKQPITSAAFWAGARPPGYPLLMKAIGPTSLWVLRIQLLLHVVGWPLAAWALVRRCATPWVRVGGFAVIVFGSLSPGLFGWTHTSLTESLSISLLLIAIGLVLLGRLRAVAVICLLWWITIRDLDVIWLATAALAYATLSRRRASLYAVAVSLLLAVVVGAGIRHGQRWRFPMVNIIGRRVLTYPERKDRWLRDGMPDNAKTRCFAGLWASDCKRDYSGFEPWLTERARRTYATELLRDPSWLLVDPLRHWKELLCGDYTELGNGPLSAYFRAKPALLQQVVARVFLSKWKWLLGELVVALALLAWAWRRAGLRLDARTLPLAVLGATVYPTMLVAWHGDAMEMQRHALLAMVSLRLAMWGAIAVAGDALWQRYVARRAAVSSAASPARDPNPPA